MRSERSGAGMKAGRGPGWGRRRCSQSAGHWTAEDSSGCRQRPKAHLAYDGHHSYQCGCESSTVGVEKGGGGEYQVTECGQCLGRYDGKGGDRKGRDTGRGCGVERFLVEGRIDLSMFL